MSRFKQLVHALIAPPRWLVFVLVPLCAAGLAAVFLCGLEESPFAWALYPLSAYTTFFLCLYAVAFARRIHARMHRNAHLHRYLTDPDYRAKVSLYLSLLVNLAYCAFKTFTALLTHSTWIGSLAFTYLVLSVVRFLLVCHVLRAPVDPVAAYRRFRDCGFVLLALTLAVSVISFHTLWRGNAIHYPGFTIYAAAAYTFYSLALSLVNLRRFRKHSNPIYTASKIISFSASLVSLFFLQVALISTFGDGDVALAPLNLFTAAAVFVLVGFMAFYMIVRGARGMKACKTA